MCSVGLDCNRTSSRIDWECGDLAANLVGFLHYLAAGPVKLRIRLEKPAEKAAAATTRKEAKIQ